MKIFISLSLLFTTLNIHAQPGNKTLTYPEVIQKYRQLDSLYSEAKMITYGKTDCGEPLHLFVISKNQIFDPVRIHESGKCVLFIINGIHPGEPDGIEASILLAKELIEDPLKKSALDNVVVCIIPVFNIDGALQRSCCSRINQNGPEEYGFRANSKNLDLNRDFIKADSRNTLSLINIIRKWDPDVAIDTHVSDGADYQYTMTFITSQHNKLNPVIGNFISKEFSPALYSKMRERKDEMIPYVNIHNSVDVPDSGITAFLESPRYLCGYMSLFNTFSFISESHMLKPFAQRVNSTLNILSSLVEVCDEKKDKILTARKDAAINDLKQKTFYYKWTSDRSIKEEINFNGYTAGYKTSKVTGKQRLFYDRNKPYSKNIPYYNSYKTGDSLTIPKYFLIPGAWEEIIQLLDKNDVQMTRVTMDSTTDAVVTYMSNYETVDRPFEGHYLHYNVKTRKEIQKIEIKKGDCLIPLPQKNMRYVLETLVPDAVDSYFCWGFFDSYLQQKEWFSPYVYEDIAEKLLETNTKMKSDFESWQKSNPDADDVTQLNYIYQHSPEFEKTFNRYPVVSIY